MTHLGSKIEAFCEGVEVRLEQRRWLFLTGFSVLFFVSVGLFAAAKLLWYDEIVTLNRANLPLAELVIDALKHKHYPTYFLLLGPFASADIDEWTLRFPSAVFGAASMVDGRGVVLIESPG